MPAPLLLLLDTNPGQDDALALLVALAVPERLDAEALFARMTEALARLP
jgi:inosine-uridine nucleoside N-ribohydrolase